MLAGYNRKTFSAETGISAVTLRVWEEPTANRQGITAAGTKRLLTALKKCGVICSESWLIHGIGVGPSLERCRKNVVNHTSNEVTWNEEESIFKDIESFKANNHNPIVAMIIDDSMLPLYTYGDYVAGSKKINNDIELLIGLNCIIELKTDVIIRKLNLCQQSKKYILSSLNNDASITNQIMYNPEIISAAQVVWHRTKEKPNKI